MIEDGSSLSMGSQINGDVSEGVGDVTGHHHEVASVYRHLTLRAPGVVPACVENTLFMLQPRSLLPY